MYVYDSIYCQYILSDKNRAVVDDRKCTAFVHIRTDIQYTHM